MLSSSEHLGRTFNELAAVDLAGRDLKCDNMALESAKCQQSTPKTADAFQQARQKAGCRICTNLRLVQQLDWDADCARHVCCKVSVEYLGISANKMMAVK